MKPKYIFNPCLGLILATVLITQSGCIYENNARANHLARQAGIFPTGWPHDSNGKPFPSGKDGEPDIPDRYTAKEKQLMLDKYHKAQAASAAEMRKIFPAPQSVATQPGLLDLSRAVR